MVFDAVAQHNSGILSMNSFKQFMKHKGLNVKTNAAPPLNENFSIIKDNGRLPTLEEAEELLISEALKRANGNQGIAASLLGLTRQALNKRIKRNEAIEK
ncbi:MAG: helix-turn-helix domain-containing protein [Nitrospirae bacterium]|nr:helix-turn-helix domain-containing protein [Nitrospirota bacterium]